MCLAKILEVPLGIGSSYWVHRMMMMMMIAGSRFGRADVIGPGHQRASDQWARVYKLGAMTEDAEVAAKQGNKEGGVVCDTWDSGTWRGGVQ
jgi:hypothetical protein